MTNSKLRNHTDFSLLQKTVSGEIVRVSKKDFEELTHGAVSSTRSAARALGPA